MDICGIKNFKDKILLKIDIINSDTIKETCYTAIKIAAITTSVIAGKYFISHVFGGLLFIPNRVTSRFQNPVLYVEEQYRYSIIRTNILSFLSTREICKDSALKTLSDLRSNHFIKPFSTKLSFKIEDAIILSRESNGKVTLNENSQRDLMFLSWTMRHHKGWQLIFSKYNIFLLWVDYNFKYANFTGIKDAINKRVN